MFVILLCGSLGCHVFIPPVFLGFKVYDLGMSVTISAYAWLPDDV